MAATLRVLAILELIGTLLSLPPSPGAVSTLAQELGVTPLLVSLFAWALMVVAAWGWIQLWRLRRSGLLIARALAALSLPLVVAKYWRHDWSPPAEAGVNISCAVVAAVILFAPSAARACGSAMHLGGGHPRAGESAP